MEERRYDGNVKFTPNATQEMILEGLTNPENKSVTLHKEGSRTIYGGMVYEVQDGKFKKVGLSWSGTEETIKEHEEKTK